MDPRVSWVIAAASATGTSHIANGQSSQDECWAFYENARAEGYLCALVADGAGSARFGGEGAQKAVEAARTFIHQELKQDPSGKLSSDLAYRILGSVRATLKEAAEHAETSIREFATTLLGLVVTDDTAMAFQVGDGGIVVEPSSVGPLALVFQPMAGEFVNTTYFVTDTDAEDRCQVLLMPTVIRAALFSDGLQRLALRMAEGEVHVPFFKPLFDVMEGVTPDQRDALDDALRTFLDSKEVNARTDDDKTLILALWCSPPTH